MELKLNKKCSFVFASFVLIVPYGIETFAGKSNELPDRVC